MDKYEVYKQELIESVVRKEVDAFGLVDYIIELCKKIDRLDKKLNNETKKYEY